MQHILMRGMDPRNRGIGHFLLHFRGLNILRTCTVMGAARSAGAAPYRCAASPNKDMAVEIRRVIAVVVIVTGPGWRQRIGRAALPGRQETNRVDFAAVGMLRTSCGRLSLLMNVTRPPTAIVTSSGLIPADAIVMVAVDGGGAGNGEGGGGAGAGAGTGAGDTDDGDGADDPHPAMTAAAQAVTRREITFRAR